MMSPGGLSKARLDRMHEVMAGYVARGEVPGVVTLVSRRGEAHVDAIGMKAVGGSDPMRRDTIFRIASRTKPITAAAAMILVEECKLRLDEPVDRLLPELADRKVLKRLDGPLDDTVPANRPISLRDLLTLRMGFGYIMDTSRAYPIVKAANEQQILQGPPKPQTLPAPDEWIRRVAPLGMKDTGFSVPASKLDRLATSYWTNPLTGAFELYDAAEGGQWSRPPAFPSAAGGLVSTIDDYLAFGQMMLNKGKHGSERILSRPSVETMTTDQLTAEQKAASGLVGGYFDSHGWGFGLSVITRRDDVAAVPGRFGWDGGLGTSWYSDPREALVGILMTQRAWISPSPPGVCLDFWTSAYQAIDD